MDTKYPNIKVQLTGEDGSAFAIIGQVSRAMRRGGVSGAEVTSFQTECQASSSYDELLRVVMRTVDVL